MNPFLFVMGAAGAGIGYLLSKVKKGTSSLPVDAYATNQHTQVGQCDMTAKPGVKQFRQWVISNYGERSGSPENIIAACNAARTVASSEHWEGRAWDWMIPSPEAAERLIAALTENQDELARRAGIMYMIYNRRMWRAYEPRGWSPYTGPNPHTDHIHFSFSWDGARGLTSFYRNQ